MPLNPVPTYTSWQLACIAAIEPRKPNDAQARASQSEIHDELCLRGKSDADIDDMIALVKFMAPVTRPVVCKDIEDLIYGIDIEFENDCIDKQQKQLALDFIQSHTDAPREPMSDAERIRRNRSPAFLFGQFCRSIFRKR